MAQSRLPAASATITGGLQVENTPADIGFWNSPTDFPSWNVHFDAPGTYAITATVAAANGASSIVLNAGPDKSAAIPVASTGDWNTYAAVNGTINISAAGDVVVTVKPADPANWQAINLQQVVLKKAQ